MKSNSQMLSLVVMWLASCSGELRTKPQLDCAPGADPQAIACSDGIIGSCAGGSPQYAVCKDIAVCQEGWQESGAYKCSRASAPEDAGLLMYARGSSDAYLQGATARVAGDANADGILSPGEAGTVSVELRNAGENMVRNVTGTLSVVHPGVTITSGSELHFGDLERRATACGASTPERAGDCGNFSALTKLKLDESFALSTIQFELTTRDLESNSITLTFDLDLTASERF